MSLWLHAQALEQVQRLRPRVASRLLERPEFHYHAERPGKYLIPYAIGSRGGAQWNPGRSTGNESISFLLDNPRIPLTLHPGYGEVAANTGTAPERRNELTRSMSPDD